MKTASGSPRIAIFTHDTFGLGHVRRCLHIARALSERAPQASILLITGTPAKQIFEELPANADYIKVPTIARTGPKRLRPAHLPLPLVETTGLRARLIREALIGFGPDVLLVDNFPLGSRGELLAALQELRRRPTRTVLGLRDILDAPEVVRRDWTRQGIYEVLDRAYDRILVYGMREILDLEQAYALSTHTAAKLRYCGYVTAPAAPAENGADLGLNGRFLLASGGGGGDAYPLLSAFLQALTLIPETPAAVVTGPLMSATQRSQLRGLLNGGPHVQFRDYVPNLRRYMGAADLVVAMCGYNTAAEIMATGARAVVVPRTWRYGEHQKGTAAGVEWEQALRASALARLGRVTLLEPETLSPERLADCISEALSTPTQPSEIQFNTDGLDRVTDQILALSEC